ncbi:HEPN domain-containing protein [Alistipes senegalensis]|uniref:HEPN domain-containing protein n=1 Tax=Alistipes senegalensis JC50 TaxID=1033732 RepID=A0ABY5V690_9BACT|nr:HEPN domain-containing protein [Alistipes senegalensis]UEA87275.1 HEPN domain-containing protein [Alistipes senegalensis]UWN65133.1 HEPN domain-containing protein [Alistipes senegalensis JC50]
MKNSIDFLPERKQRDLRELAALIRDEVKDVVMIILYGSYAANTYVERDERRDYGVRTIYMSDYDLLVVTKRRLGERESTVEARIRERFAAGKNDENLPRPQIINESISKLNDALTMGRYFYVEIVAKGIMLYDSGECQLATPGELDYAEIKKMAEEYYDDKFSDGLDFFKGANFYYQEENYHMTAFMLHQATESFLKTIPLVYILYGYKEHDLQFLIEKCKPYTLELAKVFPCDTDEEKRLFDLLRRAYLEARYNKKNFIVTKADIDALVPKIELLRDIVEKVCKERIAEYCSFAGSSHR